jgi:predicted transcriptional regulator
MVEKNKRRKKSPTQLTDVELELMTILWSLGEGTVREVMEKLPKGRDLAYTSVSTVLRILEQKGVLESRKAGASHIYVPLLDKETYESSSVKHLVSTVFADTPANLVARLVSDENLSAEDLQRIRAILDERLPT